jgi:olefin beta-lactone synthetase
MDKAFNIIDLFYEAATAYPDKVAIVQSKEQISFSALERDVKQTASYFHQKGIQKGDRVLVFVPMSIDLYRIVLALFHLGATAVFLDEWVSKQRMEESCKVANCHAFIGIWKARMFSFFSSELRKIPVKLGIRYSQKGEVMIAKAAVQPNDTALITFTTGSTGIPKAAMRTHKILYNQFAALHTVIDPQPNDIDLCALPIVLLINLAAGCTSVIAEYNPRKPELMNAEKIFHQLKKHQVTRFVASPFFNRKLAEYMTVKNLSLPQVSKVFTGGAPVFPTDAGLLANTFANAQVKIVYGSTEAEPISSINAKDLAVAANNNFEMGLNTGKPHLQTKVKIIELTHNAIACATEDELNKISVAANTIGEIIVSGKHVVREYFNNEEATRQHKIFIGNDCWHRTGDSGYLTPGGDLYFTGRCNTLMKRNEKLISPLLYENCFQQIAGVEIGTIMEVHQKIIAVIELKENSEQQKIHQLINQSDIKFDDVKYIKKMPRDPRHHSKIDYAKLKEIYL